MERQRKTLRQIALAVAVAASSIVGAPLWAETYLLMAEEDGCIWCARWDRDVSTEYPLTAEGKAAPLRRVDIHQPLPDGIELAQTLQFTPTFVLIQDGQEVGRLEGYPGEEFFWFLLQELLAEAGEPIGGEG